MLTSFKPEDFEVPADLSKEERAFYCTDLLVSVQAPFELLVTHADQSHPHIVHHNLAFAQDCDCKDFLYRRSSDIQKDQSEKGTDYVHPSLGCKHMRRATLVLMRRSERRDAERSASPIIFRNTGAQSEVDAFESKVLNAPLTKSQGFRLER